MSPTIDVRVAHERLILAELLHNLADPQAVRPTTWQPSRLIRERAACDSLDRLLSLTRPSFRAAPGESTGDNIGSYQVIHRHEPSSLTAAGLTTINIKRANQKPGSERLRIESIQALEAVARDIYDGLDDDQEHFVIIALDNHRGMLGYKVIASGGRISVEVEPRILFVSALLLGAVSIIALHNHPSGDPAPSEDDISLTIRLQAIGQLLGVPIKDHLIYSEGTCHSLLAYTP